MTSQFASVVSQLDVEQKRTPPLVITKAEIDEFVDILGDELDEVLAGLPTR